MKTIITYNGTALPAGGQTVTLFNSVVAFPPGQSMQICGEHYWFVYSIKPDANATGNSVTGQYSNDKGVTWNEFYASAANQPIAGAGATFIDEVFIGPFKDVRFLFINGPLPQTTFIVNMSLDGANRSVSGS